jgi:ribosomal-protein-alanine N-acetyltransferase
MTETNRLVIMPLNQTQLAKYIKCDGSLEKELGLEKSSRSISNDLQEALQNTILPSVADKSKNYLYSTIWTAINKKDNKMVGDVCFVGEPNSEGEVEIGYGMYEEFQGQGFMTEIVGGMIAWARTHPNIKAIIASTEKNNKASYKVLQKNSFEKAGENDIHFNWKLIL